MKKILLIDDSKEIYVLVKQAIGNIADLTWAESIKKAQSLLGDDIDLILLDIELPDGNGFDFFVQIQAKCPRTSTFFLTSNDDLSAKVLGFSAGADDYITKPFAPLELRARVEAKLNKMDFNKFASEVLHWQEIQINKNRQEVKINIDGNYQLVDLTALEFKILTYFSSQPGNVIPRDKILDNIWGKDVHIYPRSVDTHVSKLRKKLGPVSGIIESIHGSGYKFKPTT